VEALAPTNAAAEPVRIALGNIVNPGDAARAVTFSVEVVAANTLASANSRLSFRSGAMPAATVAPVVLSSGSTTWYRAIAGAWEHRADADAWLTAARERGEFGNTTGRVIETPLALLLLTSKDDATIEAERMRWAAQGVTAYALRGEDGMTRLYAGAFEDLAQTALLAMTLRDAGAEPQVAYRIGRMF
jgi:hypothetical protein